MAASTTNTARIAIPPKFIHGDDFLHSLGDVPMSRVVFNPWPGTATEHDLLELVERDKRLCELIDGTLVEKPLGLYESLLAAWLTTYLNLFLETNPIGIVTGEAGLMRLTSGRIRIPDVAFISSERLKGHQLSSEAVPSITPDLAVEVISESNSAAEMQQKTREYFQSGVRLVWLIYPRHRTVAIFESAGDEPTRILDQQGILDGGVVIPGFSLDLNKLFSKLPK